MTDRTDAIVADRYEAYPYPARASPASRQAMPQPASRRCGARLGLRDWPRLAAPQGG